MNRFIFSAFFVVATIACSLQIATGQMMNATVQTTGSRGTSTTATKPIATNRAAPHVVRAPGLSPQRLNPNPPRPMAPLAAYLQRTYSPIVRSSTYAVATLNTQRGGPVQQTVTVDPVIRQTKMRTVAAIPTRGIVTREGNIVDPATRQKEVHTLVAAREPSGLAPEEAKLSDAVARDVELRTLETTSERHGFDTNGQSFATINPQRHFTDDAPDPARQGEKLDAQKDVQRKKVHNKKDRIGFDEAFRRHWHEWHDRTWWHNHCDTVVFVTTGYYFLDGSYWYPAFGYDPLQNYYDYDGPIYTYGNLLPDEVIANVQTALQDAGYYYGPITGSLSVDTRAAIANFQRDYGLAITGAIDEDTVEALALN